MRLLVVSLLLISLIGCGKHYVIDPIDGGKTITITVSEYDRLFSSNERLLQALDECQND
jgi:hypothetical protein